MTVSTYTTNFCCGKKKNTFKNNTLKKYIKKSTFKKNTLKKYIKKSTFKKKYIKKIHLKKIQFHGANNGFLIYFLHIDISTEKIKLIHFNYTYFCINLLHFLLRNL